jgi:hypothetical protein
MSAPLKEVRIYVPEWVHIYLTSRAKAFGQDIGAIAREQVVAYAKREAHAHRMAEKAFRNTGMQPELFGDLPEDDGSRPEDVGARRNTPERQGGRR